MEKFSNIDKKRLEVETKENAFKLTDIFSGKKSAVLSYLSEINISGQARICFLNLMR